VRANGSANDGRVAFELWTDMSRRGPIRLALLDFDQKRIAHEMVARRLVVARDEHLHQDPGAGLHRWEGLA